MKKVIKRDGRKVKFDPFYIKRAIGWANDSVEENKRISEEVIDQVVDSVIFDLGGEEELIDIEKIQDAVEKELSTVAFDVAKSFILFRNKRAKARENTIDKSINEIVGGTSKYWNEENSNKNATLITTQRDYIAGEVSTDAVRRYLLPEDIIEAHDKGIIHFHDADYFLQTMNNCGLVNLEDMLQNGTVISGTKIDKPHEFSTACNIATQIIAQVASFQYGGQSISLAHLSPFVEESRKNFKKNYPDLTAEQIERMVNRDIEKGVQTLQYQIVTLMTTNGQSPFVTLYMNLAEVPEGKEREDLAKVIEEVIKQRYKGVKNEQGVYITIAFPKLIYALDDFNAPTNPNSKYYYLTELAAKCTAKRLVPDYISNKIQREFKSGDIYPCMGAVKGDEIVSIKFNNTEYNSINIEKAIELLDAYTCDINWINNDFEKRAYTKYKNIENENCFVKSENKWVKILKIEFNDIDSPLKLYEVVFEKNNKKQILHITQDHPLHTTRGRVIASDLLVGDRIYDCETLEEYEIISVKETEEKCKTYDFTTSNDMFDLSGIISHNCRSFLTVDRFSNNVGNISNAMNFDQHKGHIYYGRFNQGVVTIDLPHVALSSHKNEEEFWKIFDERLELCHRALQCRHNRLMGTKSDVAPILWQHGAYARLNKGETIDKLLFDGYSTISLGYAGLYECVKYMTGESHTSEGGKPFAIKVMQRMNDKCAEWKKAENIDYSLYGTPLESTTYKFAKSLKEAFPEEWNKLSGKDYITNSYHVNVQEKIDAFTKLTFESQFQKLSPGGAISYVEVPNMEQNIPAVMQIMGHINDQILYAEINTKSDYCQVCGFTGEIKVKGEPGNMFWECPKCGNRDQTKMNVARRTCGYIGSNYWNQGRTQEISERVLHIDQ